MKVQCSPPRSSRSEVVRLEKECSVRVDVGINVVGVVVVETVFSFLLFNFFVVVVVFALLLLLLILLVTQQDFQ